VRAIGQQLAAGLAAAHDLGLAHRDIKPENVLFDAAEAGPFGGTAGVKLADFGLARTLQPADPGAGELPSVSGSPAYMAPEQFTGAFRAASDLYALGVILYELFHGSPPFAGSPNELARRHLYEPPAIDPALAPPWPDLLRGLLAKDAAVRPAARELGRLLDAVVPRHPPAAEPDGSHPVAAFAAAFGSGGISAVPLYPPAGPGIRQEAT
jgi:serine/threonine-protein kinase